MTRIQKAEKRTAEAFLEMEFRYLSHAIKQLRDNQKHKGWQANPKQKNTLGMKIEQLIKYMNSSIKIGGENVVNFYLSYCQRQ